MFSIIRICLYIGLAFLITACGGGGEGDTIDAVSESNNQTDPLIDASVLSEEGEKIAQKFDKLGIPYSESIENTLGWSVTSLGIDAIVAAEKSGI